MKTRSKILVVDMGTHFALEACTKELGRILLLDNTTELTPLTFTNFDEAMTCAIKKTEDAEKAGIELL